MKSVDVEKIAVANNGQLTVKPTRNPNKMFRFIYRAAMEVDWSEDNKHFFCPVSKEWTSSDWYKQILKAVASEMGIRLSITKETIWENVSLDDRAEIERLNSANVT